MVSEKKSAKLCQEGHSQNHYLMAPAQNKSAKFLFEEGHSQNHHHSLKNSETPEKTFAEELWRAPLMMQALVVFA